MIVLSKYFCTIIGMISIIRISDGEKHFSEATNEYLKRLSHNVELYTIKPIKHTEIPYIKREETKKLIEKIHKFKWRVILCDERGEDIDTIGFSNILQKWRNEGENMIFVIGWSYGVDREILLKEFQIRSIKLSSLVMPHGLAYLVLIEQIYRALEIMKWSGYHHI